MVSSMEAVAKTQNMRGTGRIKLNYEEMVLEMEDEAFGFEKIILDFVLVERQTISLYTG